MHHVDPVQYVRKELLCVARKVVVTIRNQLHQLATVGPEAPLVHLPLGHGEGVALGCKGGIPPDVDWAVAFAVLPSPKGVHDHHGGHLGVLGLVALLAPRFLPIPASLRTPAVALTPLCAPLRLLLALAPPTREL